MVEQAVRLFVVAALTVAGCTAPFAHVHARGHDHTHAHGQGWTPSARASAPGHAAHGHAADDPTQHGPHWHFMPQTAAEVPDGVALVFDGDGYRHGAVALSALAVATSSGGDPSSRAFAAATWGPSGLRVSGPVITVEVTARSNPPPRYPLATRAPPA